MSPSVVLALGVGIAFPQSRREGISGPVLRAPDVANLRFLAELAQLSARPT